MAGKKTEKGKGGRKSLYDQIVKPHLAEIEEAKKAGATDNEIAEAFGVGLSTLQAYKKQHKELSDALSRGRARVVFKIKAAALKCATGFEYVEERTTAKKDKAGERVVQVERYKRYYPPNPSAQAMLLRNYDPDFRETDKLSADLRRDKAELERAIAEANNLDLEIRDHNNTGEG